MTADNDTHGRCPMSITTTGQLNFELVKNPEALRELEPQWRALVEGSASPELMQHPDWAMTWWRHYGAGRTLCVGVFRDQDEIVGIAPMCRRTSVYPPGLPFRRLELMGASNGDPDGVCGEYLGLIASPGYEHRVAGSFSNALSDGRFGPWDECVLEEVGADSSLREATFRRSRTTSEEASKAYFLALPKDWDTYLAALHSKRRKWFRLTWKNFVSWVGDRGYEIVRATDASSLSAGLKILADLHAERWKQDGRDGVFASNRFADFHAEYAAKLLERGQLELMWLTVGGEAAAAVYGFAFNKKVYVYQTGRKMGAPANVRLGIVMHILAIQSAMSRGLREYDFLGGESQYKPYFTSTTRSIVRVRVARRTVREAALQALRFAVRGARRLRSRFKKADDMPPSAPQPDAEPAADETSSIPSKATANSSAPTA